MWNSLHLGNYGTCRCASHKKHHEVKGKQLAGAFQSSSMALTDLDTLASTFRCFSLHTPQTSTSHQAHYPTTTLKLWRVATSGVFPVLFLAATSSLRLLDMSLLAKWERVESRGGKMLIGMFAKFKRVQYPLYHTSLHDANARPASQANGIHSLNLS